jgi:hypothetical protein
MSKGRRLQDTEDIMTNVTATLNALPFNAFSGCFMQLSERSKNCAAGNGD